MGTLLVIDTRWAKTQTWIVMGEDKAQSAQHHVKVLEPSPGVHIVGR